MGQTPKVRLQRQRESCCQWSLQLRYFPPAEALRGGRVKASTNVQCKLMSLTTPGLFSPCIPEVASTFPAPAVSSRDLCPALPCPELMSFPTTPPPWCRSSAPYCLGEMHVGLALLLPCLFCLPGLANGRGRLGVVSVYIPRDLHDYIQPPGNAVIFVLRASEQQLERMDQPGHLVEREPREAQRLRKTTDGPPRSDLLG
ncbi:hypothetical protein BDP81DRAFT_108586 [Colletotrichum phormii]|uniref:Uncharacterized protein n=1 Tax=Colletotrichum phormii TaxID=359342 RepID=A0AAI9ZGY6_9PEZI|nr:uncharacterized protein BDP81DRAFT_108586 [Colletotrichum phormii]KAK1624365.1 hypothetical protein BDP81DRAFT_108586 [Colletotrichum phormii]